MVTKKHAALTEGKYAKRSSGRRRVCFLFSGSSVLRRHAQVIQFSAAYCKTVFKMHVKLRVADHSRLVGAMFVYSLKFRLAQVIQTTVVTLPVYNRHQDPACIGGRPLFVRVDHARACPPPAIIRDRPLMEYRPLLEDLQCMVKVYLNLELSY